MIYLDANFFAFALLDTTSKGQNASSIQEDIVNGKEDAITSSRTLDELMWVLLKNKKKELLRRAVEGVYEMPNLKVITVEPDIPLLALDFIEQYSLKPRDAFHIAIMKNSGVARVVTDDSDFDRVEWIERINL